MNIRLRLYADDLSDACYTLHFRSESSLQPEPPRVETVPVNRLYNPYSQVHPFTADRSEAERLWALGWNDEGIAWYAPEAGTGAETIVRLYNPWNEDHYYVPQSDYDQLHRLTSLGWQLDGEESWFDSASPDEGYEVYTLFNPYRDLDTHFWTTSDHELADNCRLGWRQDETSIWASAL